jgi:formylglycine-generating enzyme required for sulfatase activity
MLKFRLSLLLIASAMVLTYCSSPKQTAQKTEPAEATDLFRDGTILVEGNGEISDFYLGQYEVTQEEYENLMGYNPSHFKGRNLPVENVTWFDVIKYCNRLSENAGFELYYNLDSDPVSMNETANGYRLPDRIEWRYAASGGNKSNGYEYSGSNNLDEVAWYKENGGGKTHPVGGKKPNELGFYDMSGNVYEWLQGTGRNIPIFGGCFGDVEEYARIKGSNFSTPGDKSQYTGFRIARSVKLEP